MQIEAIEQSAIRLEPYVSLHRVFEKEYATTGGTNAMRTIMLFIPFFAFAWHLPASAQDIWPDAVKSRPTQAAPISELIAGLKRKLEENPNDAGGWLLLAKSYRHLEQPVDARQAYLKSRQLGRSDSDLESWLSEQPASDSEMDAVLEWLSQESGHE